jgi:hypothetical protein
MAEPLSASMPGAFAMVSIGDTAGPVRRALQAGAINLDDLGVLLLLIDHVVWQSCRYWGSADELAAAAGCPVAVIEKGLANLQRAGLIARGRCRRLPASRGYWCPLPAVATTGGSSRRYAQWAAYARALEEAAPASRRTG